MAETTSSDTLPANWALRFFTIWTGQAFSLFGSAIVQFALVWYLTQETGSATILATASLAAMLPQVVLGPFVGALIDRWSRRWVMVCADGGIALVTVGLIYLFWSGNVQIWHIYVVMALRSLGSAFHMNSMQASTTLMVPDKHLARVAGMNQTLQGLVSIVAPPVGALLITVLATQVVLSIDIVTALMAIVPLLFLSVPQPVRQDNSESAETKTSFLEDVRLGFRYVAAWPGLMAILFMAAFLNFLLTPLSSLMPLLVTKYFGLGALELGWTDSSWGIGMIAGGVLLSIWGGFSKKVVTSLFGIIGLGLGVLILGSAPANMYWVALAGMGLLGFFQPITNGPLMAVLQTVVRPDMQGRVMSLIGSVALAMSPLSLLVAGPISDWLGIRIWYWVGGGLCLLIGIGAFFVPVIMDVEHNRRESGPAIVPAVK